MKLYTSFGPNPAVVNAYALEKDLKIETVMLDITLSESRQKPYIEWNPAGTMPLLELNSGSFIAESISICEYLDEVMPGKKLIGDTAEDRARTRMWLRRIDIFFVQPASSGWRFAEGLDFIRNYMRVIPHAAEDLKSIAMDGLKWIDRSVGDGDYVCGQHLTLADILLYVFVEFGAVSGQPPSGDLMWIPGWRERISAHPLSAAVRLNGATS